MDLFVRESNKSAIKLYEKLGYKTYYIIQDYYEDCSDSKTKVEAAYDMRKVITKDPTFEPFQEPPKIITKKELVYI